MKWLLDFDMNAFRAVHVGWSNPVLDVFFFCITSTGLGWVQALLLLPFFRKVETRRIGWQLAFSGALPGLSNLLLKHIVPRERPSNLIWANPKETAFYDSFPSGHSVTSFGIGVAAFLMSRNTPYAKYGNLALVWACLVGLSRIYQGVHWPTDVLGGAAIGAFWACGIHLFLAKRRNAGAPE